MSRIERNRDALMALARVSEATRRALLPSLSRDTVLALVECAKNIIIGNVTLDAKQLAYMRRHEQDLRRLVRKATADRDRVRILQKGGFLMKLLARRVGS